MVGRMTTPNLEVRVAARDKVTVLTLIGWLASSNQHLLDESFTDAMRNGACRFVVDLEHVRLSDNSALAVFAYWTSTLHERGGCVVLASPSEESLRVLAVGGMDKYLAIRGTIDEAVKLAKRKTESGRWAPVTV